VTARIRLVEVSLWAATACLIAAALLGKTLINPAPDASTREIADEALARIVAMENAIYREQGHFGIFGPSDQERQLALPRLQLDAPAAQFEFDALEDGTGSLKIRAITKPEAVAGGAAPLAILRTLPALAAQAPQEIGSDR